MEPRFEPRYRWVFKDRTLIGSKRIVVYAPTLAMAREKALGLITTDDYTPTHFDLDSVDEVEQ
jgi:hypothetical protein